MWIAHPADRRNVLRALAAPIILLSLFWHGFPDGCTWLAAVVIFAVIGDTNYILHIHRPFATRRWLNLVLDLCMGLTTGMTASNWRIQHRYGHHRGIDEGYRPDRAWETARYSALWAVSFATRSIWPTFWRPLAESFRKGVLNDVRSPISFRWAFAEQCLLIIFVLTLSMQEAWLVFTFILPWYALTYFISRYVDYLNHYGCDEHGPNPYERANNSLNRVFNWSCNNFGYHTAHHLRPSAHWTEMPTIHETIAERIPERLLSRSAGPACCCPTTACCRGAGGCESSSRRRHARPASPNPRGSHAEPRRPWSLNLEARRPSPSHPGVRDGAHDRRASCSQRGKAP